MGVISQMVPLHFFEAQITPHGLSAVPARLGLKAAALAWLETALAFSTHRPGQSRQPGPGLGLARPRPQLLYVKCSNFAHRSVGCTGS